MAQPQLRSFARQPGKNVSPLAAGAGKVRRVSVPLRNALNRKLRSDSRLSNLPPKQLAELQQWLFQENVKLAEAVARLRDRFKVQISITALARFYRHLEQQRIVDQLMRAAPNPTGDKLSLLELAHKANGKTLLALAQMFFNRQFKPDCQRLAAEKVLEWAGDESVRQIAAADADRAVKLDQVHRLIFGAGVGSALEKIG